MNLLALALSLFSLAPPAPLPIAVPEQLQPGASYTWTYFRDGQPYSTERYDFLEANGTELTFTLSSRLTFAGQNEFHLTHKVIVDYARCLAAHRDPRQKHAFLVKMFAVDANGEFPTTPYLNEATAFEEKFNCHGWVRTGFPSLYETKFVQAETLVGPAQLFQQHRQPADQLTAFYFLDHPALAGVAAQKTFRAGDPVPYEMRLVAWHLPGTN